MMGKVLFKFLGFDVSIFKILMGVGGAVALWFVYDSITDHFQHIKDLETENDRLGTKVTRVEGQRDAVIDLNKDNAKAAELEEEVRDNNQEIATAERAAARERAQTYQEIRNAITSQPEASDSRQEQPVAPVISDTLGRLWNNTDSPAGSQGSNQNEDGIR